MGPPKLRVKAANRVGRSSPAYLGLLSAAAAQHLQRTGQYVRILVDDIDNPTEIRLQPSADPGVRTLRLRRNSTTSPTSNATISGGDLRTLGLAPGTDIALRIDGPDLVGTLPPRAEP